MSPREQKHMQFAKGSFIAQATGGGTAMVVSSEHVPPQPVDQAELDAAQQHLAALPLDTLPNLAPLPLRSRILYRPNHSFVGREDELKTLAASLRGSNTSLGQMKTVAVSGLGGIGKTQLASEFVHRYGQYFAGGVFWLSFADPSDIPTEIVACGLTGGSELGSDFSTLPFEYQVRRVMFAWQSPLPRLLVFVNCEEEK